MIQILLPAALALVAGALLGGCAGRDPVKQALLERNAHLETQIGANQHVVTSLTATLIVMACGLASSLVWNLWLRKGGRLAKRQNKDPGEA